MITFIDLCSGIGGGRLGLEKNGFKCLGFSEILKTSIQTYKTFYDTSNEKELGDLTKLSMDNIPNADMFISECPRKDFLTKKAILLTLRSILTEMSITAKPVFQR